METITKKDIIAKVADKTMTSQSTTRSIIQCFLGEIISELARDNRLEFRDFGVFEVRMRAARTARNPKTLEPVHVGPRRTVKFKMGRAMREKLSKEITE